MALHFDILGRTYDDSAPGFLLLETRDWWDRLGNRYWTAEDLDLLAKRKKDYQWPLQERGYAPASYRLANPGLGLAVEVQPIPEDPPQPETSWTKAQILAWLEEAGVSIAERHLGNLSKVELLAFIDDMQDTP
jgi:hypothetical protein